MSRHAQTWEAEYTGITRNGNQYYMHVKIFDPLTHSGRRVVFKMTEHDLESGLKFIKDTSAE